MKPLISIGITSYNSEDTIARALYSAIKQDWENKEIIVVDDHSRDKTAEVVERIANIERNVLIYRNPKNMGCAASRNRIVDIAQGEFVAFFDDDDISLPSRIKTQLETLVEKERVKENRNLLCYTSGIRVYPNGYIMELPAIGSKGCALKGEKICNYILFNEKDLDCYYGQGPTASALMARKEIFENLGGFDRLLRRQEDSDFAVRFGMTGGEIVGIEEKLLIQHSTSGADKNSRVEHESFKRIIEKNKIYLQKKGFYSYMLCWSEIRYGHFSRNYARMIIFLLLAFVVKPIKAIVHFKESATNRFNHEKQISCQRIASDDETRVIY
jgi:glycosyltransferase involved in cell wall biosynthesis